MEDMAERWLEENENSINRFVVGLVRYKERRSISRVESVPVINLLMLPSRRSEHRFIVANLLTDEGDLIRVTPSQGQLLTEIVTKKLSEMHQGVVFSILRNRQFSIFIAATEAEIVS